MSAADPSIPRKGHDMSVPDVLRLVRSVSAEYIEPRFRALSAHEIHAKSPGDYVTVADQQAEEALTAGLLSISPDAVVVGEEGCFADPGELDAIGIADHCYVVDPLDGTNNFVRGSEDFAVMVAELRGPELVSSCIWQPRYRRAFTAEKGAGVTCNGVPIRPQPMHRPPLGASSYRAWQGFDAQARIAPVVHSTRSAGIDYPNVVTGVTDFIVFRFPKPWDHLPGQLMVQELGGDVVHLDGSLYRPGSGKGAILACRELTTGRRVAALWPEVGTPNTPGASPRQE